MTTRKAKATTRAKAKAKKQIQGFFAALRMTTSVNNDQ